MKKIQIESKVSSSPYGNMVGLSAEAMRVVNRLKYESGESVRHIVSKIIVQAYEKGLIEIIESEPEEEE